MGPYKIWQKWMYEPGEIGAIEILHLLPNCLLGKMPLSRKILFEIVQIVLKFLSLSVLP